jgi:hypothetical protein
MTRYLIGMNVFYLQLPPSQHRISLLRISFTFNIKPELTTLPHAAHQHAVSSAA